MELLTVPFCYIQLANILKQTFYKIIEIPDDGALMLLVVLIILFKSNSIQCNLLDLGKVTES
jgi:hypothetical protein